MASGAQTADEPRLVGKPEKRTSRDYKSELDRRAWEASEAIRQQKNGGGGVASSMLTTVSSLVEQAAQIVPEGKKLLGLQESRGGESSNSGDSLSTKARSNSTSGSSNNTDTTAPSQREISDAAVEAFLRDVHRSGTRNQRKKARQKK